MIRFSFASLPICSLIFGFVLLVSALASYLGVWTAPAIAWIALSALSLLAAGIDSLRLTRRCSRPGPGSESAPEQFARWIQQQSDDLLARERTINAKALALQQLMQFPDALDLGRGTADVLAHEKTPGPGSIDPMARHDRELLDLIESKTHDVFDKIKRDHYRKADGEGKSIDTNAIRQDAHSLVMDVAKIYRPDQEDPFLQTNMELLARASGRGALRLLVALERLPGGVAQYDFQTIYRFVGNAVRTYGAYQKAKPYLDVASGLFLAGRVVASTNPVTLAAWWAASRATTYGASRLGLHVVDQQAVGLIRQLVEIIAIEVASLYSPMIRYRDIHWIYGVELVHLVSELQLSDKARMSAMREIAALQLPDEYARVSLLRHLAAGTTSRPDRYRPADVLSAADRSRVAQFLETFVLTHGLAAGGSGVSRAAIDQWQTAASQRLDVQFQATEIDATPEQQLQSCVWSLAAFLLEHGELEPEAMLNHLQDTKTWKSSDTSDQSRWQDSLLSDPPFIYQWPAVKPKTPLCNDFLADLAKLSAHCCSPQWEPIQNNESPESIRVMRSPGVDAVSVTAYHLRGDGREWMQEYQRETERVLVAEMKQNPTPPIPPATQTALQCLSGGKPLRFLYSDVTFHSSAKHVIKDALVTCIDSELIVFSHHQIAGAEDELIHVHCRWPLGEVRAEKISGYVRSDCRLFRSGSSDESAKTVVITGSMLRSYDTYFQALLDSVTR
ncbi:hypothetical protein [Stieleria varia]|uniref:Uncharacterized protein n=1 Tax=Stieleria varia TaxID=2528005 RepID=A0A5C6BA43_9BACT|nr:hypothetical protein [Stieleria varia]TWU08311.1 hypothetical protein Pla52n_08930 [Stieleria varia]